MGKIIFVSNRLPITIERKKNTWRFRPSVGGLATGLGSFYQSYESVWLGWCGLPEDKLTQEDRSTIEKKLIKEHKSYPVHLTQTDLRRYYYGFSNKTIWPLFHYFKNYTVYDNSMWEAYRTVNEKFAKTILNMAEPGDTIWIHDYHLMLVPRILRENLDAVKIGFFLHIPFPSYEIYRQLPWRKEILWGLLGSDLIGFHTFDYVRHFLSSVIRLLGYEHQIGQIRIDNRIIKADAFPMGIDYDRYADSGKKEDTQKEIERIKKKVSSGKIILTVDRLDYSKGIPERLEAFELFLEKYPEFREKVTLIMVAVPSRTAVDTYHHLKRHVDELVGRINGKYGVIGWNPVLYLYRSLPFPELSALYNMADVCLVTPLRDGMNLVAKEYVAVRTDGTGVLILSEMAGSAQELGEALIVNPNDREDVVDALKKALLLSVEEQKQKNRMMQARLRRYNVERWARDFIDRLNWVNSLQVNLVARTLNEDLKKKIISEYRKSKRRLLLLDYDGTLKQFSDRPEYAQPDKEILIKLESLASDPKNEIVIVSGRDRETLDRWFGELDIGFVAEHGVWIKERGSEWLTIAPMRRDWKDEIRPILEIYVDRTPGSFVEEKDFSLVWHYRKASPELASIRVSELKDILLNMTEGLNLGVMEGNKVIEVKNAGINKGQSALRWVGKRRRWDFILFIGDDVTDEDVFTALPLRAYTIKVGYGPSKARFSIQSVNEVRKFLERLEKH